MDVHKRVNVQLQGPKGVRADNDLILPKAHISRNRHIMKKIKDDSEGIIHDLMNKI